MDSPSRAVDCHFHVFSTSAPSVPAARYRPAYAARLEDAQALWRANGITHGVVVQPSFFGTDNAEVLAAVARDREHLRAVVVVDPTFDAAAIAALDDAGAVALRLNLKGMADYSPYGSDEWRALYARLHA